MSKDGIFTAMRESIENYDSDAATAAAKQAVESGIDLLEAVEKGFAGPIRNLGEAFDRMEIFLPQLMLGSDAMKAGMAVMEEAITAGGGTIKSKGVVVIGTVEGDIHDIGNTVVAALLQANGYSVHDLGVEVPSSRFIEAAGSRTSDRSQRLSNEAGLGKCTRAGKEVRNHLGRQDPGQPGRRDGRPLLAGRQGAAARRRDLQHDSLFLAGLANQAVACNSGIIATTSHTTSGRPGSDQYAHEVSALALTAVTSGSTVSGPRPAEPLSFNNVSPPMAPLFAEVSHAAAGMKRETAAELVARLYEKYKDRIDLEQAPKGKAFEELYDLQTLRPTAEHQALYDKLKEELITLGVPLG